MIGYCAPSGVKNMDYVVVDKYTVPSNNHQQYNYFHEELMYQSPIFAIYATSRCHLVQEIKMGSDLLQRTKCQRYRIIQFECGVLFYAKSPTLRCVFIGMVFRRINPTNKI